MCQRPPGEGRTPASPGTHLMGVEVHDGGFGDALHSVKQELPRARKGRGEDPWARRCRPPGAPVSDRVDWEHLRACGGPQASRRSMWLRGACVCLQRGPPPSCTRSSIWPSPPSYRGPALKPPPREALPSPALPSRQVSWHLTLQTARVCRPLLPIRSHAVCRQEPRGPHGLPA